MFLEILRHWCCTPVKGVEGCVEHGRGFLWGGGIVKAAFLSANNEKFEWSHHGHGERAGTDAVAAVAEWL